MTGVDSLIQKVDRNIGVQLLACYKDATRINYVHTHRDNCMHIYTCLNIYTHTSFLCGLFLLSSANFHLNQSLFHLLYSYLVGSLLHLSVASLTTISSRCIARRYIGTNQNLPFSHLYHFATSDPTAKARVANLCQLLLQGCIQAMPSKGYKVDCPFLAVLA